LLVCFFIGLFVCLLGRCYVLNSAILCSSASLFVCLFVRLRPATADDGIAPDGIDAADGIAAAFNGTNKQTAQEGKQTHRQLNKQADDRSQTAPEGTCEHCLFACLVGWFVGG
jgi:hypothetical protein